jgi:hypothetical protein
MVAAPRVVMNRRRNRGEVFVIMSIETRARGVL